MKGKVIEHGEVYYPVGSAVCLGLPVIPIRVQLRVPHAVHYQVLYPHYYSSGLPWRMGIVIEIDEKVIIFRVQQW